MIKLLVAAFLSLSMLSTAQNAIDWDGVYQLQLSDFRSPATQIGDVTIVSLNTPSAMDFSFYMSNVEFMMTKNFNSKVSCSFKPQSSSLVAPDSLTAGYLLNFARYAFDLGELYTRIFRKRLYEDKGTFSDVTFIQPAFDQTQNEFILRHGVASKETDLGRNEEKLKQLHQEVRNEIQALPDFCKTCKPQKKKKS